jgi:hypothetical protein
MSVGEKKVRKTNEVEKRGEGDQIPPCRAQDLFSVAEDRGQGSDVGKSVKRVEDENWEKTHIWRTRGGQIG